MEMIIAELHEKVKALRNRARIALLAAKRLEGDTTPLSARDEAAIKALFSKKGLAKELGSVRLLAVELKIEVRANQMAYPTPAALHRRLSRACESSSMAIEAEARLLRMTDGETKMYAALMSESSAFKLEAEAHLETASASERALEVPTVNGIKKK
jgi:hypothetical protein